jgi:hypothetical protein
MNYDNLILTISQIVENENINKNGLSLQYNLEERVFNDINLDLFQRSNQVFTDFKPTDEFEVVIGGILVKIIKKQ